MVLISVGCNDHSLNDQFVILQCSGLKPSSSFFFFFFCVWKSCVEGKLVHRTCYSFALKLSPDQLHQNICFENPALNVFARMKEKLKITPEVKGFVLK